MVEWDSHYIYPPVRHPLESPANVHPEERRPIRETPGGRFLH